MSRIAALCLLTALLISAGAMPARAATSVYSDAKTDGCTSLLEPSEVDEDMGNIAVVCRGYKDYPFYFNEYDVRQSTYFGFLKPDILAGAGETFERFNHIGERIEWRLGDKGLPHATIVNYTIENLNPVTSDPDPALYGQVLVISRVGQPEDETGCVVAYVDALANADSIVLARTLADELAPTFACGREKPAFHGKVGERISEPVYIFPAATDAK